MVQIWLLQRRQKNNNNNNKIRPSSYWASSVFSYFRYINLFHFYGKNYFFKHRDNSKEKRKKLAQNENQCLLFSLTLKFKSAKNSFSKKNMLPLMLYSITTECFWLKIKIFSKKCTWYSFWFLCLPLQTIKCSPNLG